MAVMAKNKNATSLSLRPFGSFVRSIGRWTFHFHLGIQGVLWEALGRWRGVFIVVLFCLRSGNRVAHELANTLLLSAIQYGSRDPWGFGLSV